jgi:hypothetical protein
MEFVPVVVLFENVTSRACLTALLSLQRCIPLKKSCRFIFTNMIYCAGTYLMVLVFLSFGYAHDGAVQSSVQDHSYQRDSLFDQIKVNGSNPRFALLKSTDIVCLQITSPISQLRRSCNFTQFIEYNCN